MTFDYAGVLLGLVPICSVLGPTLALAVCHAVGQGVLCVDLGRLSVSVLHLQGGL